MRIVIVSMSADVEIEMSGKRTLNFPKRFEGKHEYTVVNECRDAA